MTDFNGVLLIVLAIILFIAEILTPVSFGLLMAGGLISLITGLSLLYGGIMYINPWLIATIAILVVGFLALAITKVIAIHHGQAYTGREELVGKTAVVKTALTPEGMVFFKGELWTAISQSGRIEPGEHVTISGIDGLKLCVTKRDKEVNKCP